jgi:hypothetical protein
VDYWWFEVKCWLKKSAICSWRGHQPKELGAFGWFSMTPMWMTFPDGNVEMGESVSRRTRHNTVICDYCRAILGSADWMLDD